MPTGLHAHAHLFSLGREVAIKLFRPVAVFQALLSAISRFGIYKRNLLEARVIISSYNDHCRLLSTRAFLVGLAPPSLLGASEPALLWNQLRSKWRGARILSETPVFVILKFVNAKASRFCLCSGPLCWSSSY